MVARGVIRSAFTSGRIAWLSFLIPVAFAVVAGIVFYSGSAYGPVWLMKVLLVAGVTIGLFMQLRSTKGPWWAKALVAAMYLLLLAAILWCVLLSVACTYGNDCI